MRTPYDFRTMTEETQAEDVIDIRITQDGATDGYPHGTFAPYGSDAVGRVIELLNLRYRITSVGTTIHTGSATTGAPNYVLAEARRVKCE